MVRASFQYYSTTQLGDNPTVLLKRHPGYHEPPHVTGCERKLVFQGKDVVLRVSTRIELVDRRCAPEQMDLAAQTTRLDDPITNHAKSAIKVLGFKARTSAKSI